MDPTAQIILAVLMPVIVSFMLASAAALFIHFRAMHQLKDMMHAQELESNRRLDELQKQYELLEQNAARANNSTTISTEVEKFFEKKDKT